MHDVKGNVMFEGGQRLALVLLRVEHFCRNNQSCSVKKLQKSDIDTIGDGLQKSINGQKSSHQWVQTIGTYTLTSNNAIGSLTGVHHAFY